MAALTANVSALIADLLPEGEQLFSTVGNIGKCDSRYSMFENKTKTNKQTNKHINPQKNGQNVEKIALISNN